MISFFYFYSKFKFLYMAKSTQAPTTSPKSGGEKIDAKKAAAAQKLYWDVLIGKKKITPEQLPESVSFNLYQLKAYLNEVEAEFNKLNVPYSQRFVSVLPIAYTEKGKVTLTITSAVNTGENAIQHQFNQKSSSKKPAKTLQAAVVTNYTLQIPPLNQGHDNP